ncbi:MAG: hypothetical protein ABI678_33670 [Kofleriaceae bacterium]
MSIFLLKFLAGAAGIASMTAAVERGDLDEAARQGALAGPDVVVQALRAKVRSTVLAGIVAAPATEDRAELLPALAKVASGPDRRTAIPAARAATAIAIQLARHDLADDLAPDDIQTWRATFEHLALAPGRPIEVGAAALATAAALAHVLDPRALGYDLTRALADPDPELRIAAVALVPRPAPGALFAAIAPAVGDPDDAVAFAAAQTICADATDDPAAVKGALGTTGATQIKALAKAHPAAKELARCSK